MWPIYEHKIIHFENDIYIHMSLNTYDTNGYGYDLDVLVISH